MLGKVMIDSIRAWISGGWPDHRDEVGRRQEALQVALTALLIEAAYSDDRFDEAERAVIAQLLESRFHLSPSDADALLAQRLLVRRGHLRSTATHVDLHMTMAQIDIAVRLAGLIRESDTAARMLRPRAVRYSIR